MGEQRHGHGGRSGPARNEARKAVEVVGVVELGAVVVVTVCRAGHVDGVTWTIGRSRGRVRGDQSVISLW